MEERLNAIRFVRKCLFDQRAAWKSAKTAAREVRASIHWHLTPDKPLRYPIGYGAHLILDKDCAFTHMICPGLDDFEPDLRAYIEQTLGPGDVFIDCGANVGYFSVLANKFVGPQGRVISIEANPLTFELLKRNLKSNGFGEPINCALTTSGGEVDLFMPAEGDVYSSLKIGGLVKEADVHSFKVKGMTVDQIVRDSGLTKVDFLKIDVEGADLDVLRSAVETIRRFRPKVSIEYGTVTWGSFGSTGEQLLSFLEGVRYEVRRYDLAEHKLKPVDSDIWASKYVNLFLGPMR
jgi:FkbM family methyltransferase